MGRMSELSLIIGARPDFVDDYHLHYLDALHATQLVKHDKYYHYLANDQEMSEDHAREVVKYWDDTFSSREQPGGR